MILPPLAQPPAGYRLGDRPPVNGINGGFFPEQQGYVAMVPNSILSVPTFGSPIPIHATSASFAELCNNGSATSYDESAGNYDDAYISNLLADPGRLFTEDPDFFMDVPDGHRV
jgi:hypothetical protein